jgi:lipoyl(octanoyl) transferase
MPGESTLKVARLGVIDYQAALDLQSALVAARILDTIGDTLLLLEHPHVYTLGRGADAGFILDPPADIPLHRVSRGGQVTYHGPGQLVGYPILKLEGAERDVIRYLRKLEQVIANALATVGIEAQQREGLTGVWVGNEKIASIGVGIRRWTTLHGFAINVATDLRFFERIVPCGIAGCRMTSITELGRPTIKVTEFGEIIARAFAAVFAYRNTAIVEPRMIWNTISVDESGASAQG